MPFPSVETLKHAASDLAGCHPLTLVTIPALLAARRATSEYQQDRTALPIIERFGTNQERPILESFRTRPDGKRPYVAIWSDPPAYINADYPGSTLQRLRTQDLLGQQLFEIQWGTDGSGRPKRTGTGLKPTGGAALRERQVKPVNRVSLAFWLGRDQDLPNAVAFLDWFDQEFPMDGTGLDDFYESEIPSYAVQPPEVLLTDTPPSGEEIADALQPEDGVQALPATSDSPAEDPPSGDSAVDDNEPGVIADDDGLAWTRDFCEYPLREADVDRLVSDIQSRLDAERIVFPEAESLVRRCVTALLLGHLVLQGPPGTGKTTFARILADAFNVRLVESTATSEWSPFHVVGGLRPTADNTLGPSYGKVSDAALRCAVQVREETTSAADEGEEPTSRAQRWQGTWLLIDEFNRADIDRAIGSLYTVLSSCDGRHLRKSPIDLWFEEPDRQQLWVPARFRIIAAMNDLDTSFVNPMSQGLSRRFQFITVGAPEAHAGSGIGIEFDRSLETARDWLTTTYGTLLQTNPDGIDIAAEVELLQKVVAQLRTNDAGVAGWPIGTAQIVDVLKVVLLQASSGTETHQALDWGIADRLVPQMGQLDDLQIDRASGILDGLPNAQAALIHLINPHGA